MKGRVDEPPHAFMELLKYRSVNKISEQKTIMNITNLFRKTISTSYRRRNFTGFRALDK